MEQAGVECRREAVVDADVGKRRRVDDRKHDMALRLDDDRNMSAHYVTVANRTTNECGSSSW